MPSTTFVDLTCDYCGGPVKRALSEVNRLKSGKYKRVFCSAPCRQQGIRKYPKKWICETCGDEFNVEAANFKRSKHHFCSPQCYTDFPKISAYEPWNPEPTFAAYCAGFVDGEGWIGIKSAAHGKLIVSIANTHYGVLEHIKNGFTGHSNIAKKRSNNPRHKPSHMIVFHHNQAWAFLEGILPFLIIKREQAQVGIAFQKLPYPHRTRSEQGLIYFNRIRKLNEKGMGNLFMQMSLII